MQRRKVYQKQILKFIEAAIAAVILYGLLIAVSVFSTSNHDLSLVSVRNGLPGSFTSSQSIFADNNRIYLASSQGTLFVLKRNSEENFPLLESINFNSQLTAVVESNDKLYVSSISGAVYIFKIPEETNNSLVKIETKLVNDYGISSLAVGDDGSMVAGLGQAHVAVSGGYVFLGGLNLGDDAFLLDRGIRLAYHDSIGGTDVYTLDSGDYLGTINNYFSGAVALIGTNDGILMSKPGCCGTGIAIYSGETLDRTGTLPVRYANTAAQKDNFLIVGTEEGKISLVFENEVIGTVDLRKLTGNVGNEDIEIRALWTDDSDNFIFAASSWGNDASRSSNLPSFFVLELTQTGSVQLMENSLNSSLPTPTVVMGIEGQEGSKQIVSAITSISIAQAAEIDATVIDQNMETSNTTALPLAEERQVKQGFFSLLITNLSKALKFVFKMIPL